MASNECITYIVHTLRTLVGHIEGFLPLSHYFKNILMFRNFIYFTICLYRGHK